MVLIVEEAASLYNTTLFSKKHFAEKYVNDCSTAIIAIDINETVIIYNQAAEDIMGMPACEVIGRPFTELLDKKLGTRDSILMNSLQTGKVYSHVEAKIETPIGTMNVMAYTTIVYNKHNNIAGAILSLRDITSQKQLEEKVFNAEKLSVIGELAAGIAHEVRNPLTSVKGFLQLLAQKHDKGDQIHQYIDIMLEEIKRVNSIISEFLLISRPTVPIKRIIDIHKIIDEILLLAEGECLIKGLWINRQYDLGCPLITLDAEQIKQVFLNLVSNAISAVSGSGQLVVSSVYNRDYNEINLIFTDTGSGINDAELEKIFEPFFTTKENGTGLGLTISRRIVENHGGRLEVTSTPGKGTTFVVVLPVLEDNWNNE